MKRMFVDPASKSCGWAIFDDAVLVAHGTIAVDPVNPVEMRLRQLHDKFFELAWAVEWDEAHIEQLVRLTHIYTHYSVGVIMAALSCGPRYRPVRGDVPISSWQAATRWKSDRAPLRALNLTVDSEDEEAAICLGLYWVHTKLKL